MTTPTNTTVTYRVRSDGEVDDWGNPAPSWTDSPQRRVWLEQTSAVEVTEGRDVAVSDWLLVDPDPDAVLGHRDQVRDAAGRLFEVVGAPDTLRRPGGQAHHREARLRLVV
jgi:hypothetical protein